MILRNLWLWLSLTVVFNGYSQSYFAQQPFQEILQSAAQSKKPVFYFVQASWCPHCHIMRDQVFPDADVKAELETSFIPATIDGETDAGNALMRRYNLSSFPSFIVINADGELLYGFGGELKKPALLRELNLAKNPSRQLPTLKAAFEANPTDDEKCLEYVQTIRKARQDASEVAHRYFKNVPDEELVSATHWKIIANGIQDIRSREISYVLKHQEEFARVSSAKRVQRKLVNLAQEQLKPAMAKKDTLAYLKDRETAKLIGIHSADSLIFRYDLQFWESVSNWNRYAKTLDDAERFIWDNPQKLKDAADVLLKNTSDKIRLELAINLAARAAELQPSYDGYLLLARLYEKKSEKKRAAEWARKAREFAQSVNFGTNDADEILNRNS